MIIPSLHESPSLRFKDGPITKKGYSRYILDESDKAPKTADITVSIVSYNEGLQVLELVEQLLRMDSEARSRIVLVDNGLDDDTAQALKKKEIYYIKATDNLGPSLGRNLIASVANTPLMAILDADAKLDDSYLNACLDVMRDKNIVCARGKVIPLTSSSRVPKLYDYGDKSFPAPPKTEGISIWRTADFKKAGGFEKEIYGGEGDILCYRMIEIYGYDYSQFIYSPSIVLHHDYNSSLGQLENKQYRNLVSRWHIQKRYPRIDAMRDVFNDLSGGVISAPDPESNQSIKNALLAARNKFNTDLDELYTSNINRLWNRQKISKRNYNFSVVIPCYKLGGLLEDAIKSIMQQTLDNVQIIVVDDVSPDEETKLVLKKLEQFIQVIYRDKNGGASAARNTGIKAAKSKYILCLDADDTISPTYLEEAYNLFEMDEHAGVVAPNVKIVGERKGQWRVEDKVTFPRALLSSPIPNASCYRKEVWEQAGGYDETMRGYEDWEFWIRVLKSGWTIRNIPKPHYIYLTRPDSKVKTSNKNSAAIMSYIYNKHVDIYAEHAEYVVTHLYAKYVEQRSTIDSLRTLRLSDNGFVKRNLRRAIIKTKAATNLLIGGDFSSFSEKTVKNLNKIHSKAKSKLG